jgi:hypothetical protein
MLLVDCLSSGATSIELATLSLLVIVDNQVRSIGMRPSLHNIDCQWKT